MHKAILINPHEKVVSEIGISDFEFARLYKLLECDMIQHVPMSENTVLLCDEEGLFKPIDKQAFFNLIGHPHPITGKALLTGYDPGKGEYESFKYPLNYVQKAVSWKGKS